MSQWIRKLLMGQPMSRREFLSGTAGAAAAAAASRAPLLSAQAANAPAAATGLRAADMLPKGFHAGFELPGGYYITGRDGDAMLWGGGDIQFLSKDELDRLTQIAREAALAVGQMPPSKVPLKYNHMTKQWHADGYIPVGERQEGYRSVTPLKSGIEPPEGFMSGEETYFDEDFAVASFSEGTLTKPGKSAHPEYWKELDEGAPVARTQIDDLRKYWSQEQRALAEYYRNNPPKDEQGQQSRRRVLDNLGHYPGGWHNVGPDPFPANEMGIGGTERLDGGRPDRQSASPKASPAVRAARQMLMYGIPAAAVGVQQQQQGPVTQELLK